MAANSFRRDQRSAPLHYRTPSPPSHDFEPLSPGTEAWSRNWSQPLQRFVDSARPNGHDEKLRNVSDESNPVKGAPSSTRDRRAGTSQPSLQTQVARDERQNATLPRWNKRARSEQDNTGARHEEEARAPFNDLGPTDPMFLEAELLLNFSMKARSQSITSATASRPITQSGHAGPSHVPATSPIESVTPPDIQNSKKADALALSAEQADKTKTEDKTSSTQDTRALVAPLEDGVKTISVDDGKELSPSSRRQVLEANESSMGDPSELLKQVDASKKQQSDAPKGNAAENAQEELGSSKEQVDGQVPVPNTVGIKPPSQFLHGIEEAARAESSLPTNTNAPTEDEAIKPKTTKAKSEDTPSVCAGCNFTRNVLTAETENDATSWICCDGCKSWFHFACAGFKNEREVRSVDKYRCKKCKPIHGPTTHVRKSQRAHSAIDYAGLNEGIVKTSDENPEHHYIKPIKEGTIKFDQERFARMRPELVTADYFEKGDGMKEPIVIPAEWNPRPRHIPSGPQEDSEGQPLQVAEEDAADLNDLSALDEEVGEMYEYEQVQDVGQDSLDMVIPLDLTVRKVSEMYGPDERIEVIDVKSQNGEDKKWNMRRWVDYYEAQGSKPVRNVISLEVSQSKLGRLIRRPKVVRDLDLQDHNWPADLIAKGEFPKVQFYCLMSVADCFTDFHIDFGGSSVYYHILKGKKTFFFIPPHEKHLKKYEEWCNSPAQNWTFLGDQTKECYRVDLSEGDTMLIPAGWIHAVWTPEDSLVIGGNFLTRLHYKMQIRVTQIEKATHVARKFRYPAFQKVMWYTAMRYLERDPLPDSVRASLAQGQQFHRPYPTYLDFEGHGEQSAEGVENYHARYYSKAELEGLPDLGQYLYRTAMIAAGHITDGITADLRRAIQRSIPKVCGEPFDMIKKFAMWYTWKRGDENIPHWAYPDYVPETTEPADKKLSAKALRRLDKEAALQAWRLAPDRQSTRQRTQPQNFLAEMVNGHSPSNQSTKQSSPIPTQAPFQQPAPEPTPTAAPDSTVVAPAVDAETTEAPNEPVPNPSVGLDYNTASLKRKAEVPSLKANDPNVVTPLPKKPRTSSGQKPSANRRPACEACRKGRRACKHRDEPLPSTSNAWNGDVNGAMDVVSSAHKAPLPYPVAQDSKENMAAFGNSSDLQVFAHLQYSVDSARPESQSSQHGPDMHMGRVSSAGLPVDSHTTPSKSSGRSKACKDCRKSKRRCVHDEFGKEDPAKLEQAVIPRPAAKKKRPSGSESVEPSTIKKTKKRSVSQTEMYGPSSPTAYYFNGHVEGHDYLDESEKPEVQSMIDPQLEAQSVIDPQLEAQPVIDPQLEAQPMIDPQLSEQQPAIDPQLESMTMDTNMPDAYPTKYENDAIQPDDQDAHPPSSAYNPEDEVNLIATSPYSEVKIESHLENERDAPTSNTAQPVTSSLVSPPESTHTDAEQTPPANNKPRGLTPPVTSESSRQSSHPAKLAQRYTPESGSVRRASCGSASHAIARESVSPAAQTPHRARTKSRVNSQDDVDEESRRLIRELQTQDMGLRRRGKA